jgi:hypothetical protein
VDPTVDGEVGRKDPISQVQRERLITEDLGDDRGVEDERDDHPNFGLTQTVPLPPSAPSRTCVTATRFGDRGTDYLHGNGRGIPTLPTPSRGQGKVDRPRYEQPLVVPQLGQAWQEPARIIWTPHCMHIGASEWR